ncbi:DnaJ domain-containing protein [Arthrobacter sp. R1-13]
MSNEPADYYTVLGVADTATQQEISRAFRGLMRTRHPDVDSAGAAPTSAEVLAIMNAFGVLRDPKKRADYDRRHNRHRKNDTARTRDNSARDRGSRDRSAGEESARDHRAREAARGERPMRTSAQDIPVRYGPREVPVRRISKPSPLLRVTPVRWEEGPWAWPDVTD